MLFLNFVSQKFRFQFNKWTDNLACVLILNPFRMDCARKTVGAWSRAACALCPAHNQSKCSFGGVVLGYSAMADTCMAKVKPGLSVSSVTG